MTAMPSKAVLEDLSVAIIIPAFNEDKSLSLVISEIPLEFHSQIVVIDNNSTDSTYEMAQALGVHVVREKRQGYGSACLRGLKEIEKFKTIHYVVFLDADYSDKPAEIYNLLNKLKKDDLDLVIGSRTLGNSEPGALLPQARFGNWLATQLMYLRFRYRFTDLGPFRVIKKSTLDRIKMQDEDFGWTMEMQVKCLRQGFKVGEVPVSYKKRIGESKITGTIKGTLLAGYKILWTLFKYSLPVSGPKETSSLKNKSIEEGKK